MAVSTDSTGHETSAGTQAEGANVALVDPRAPRFGQTLTALGLGAGVALGLPALVYAVTVVLVASVVSGWRLDLYAALWRHVVVPVVGRPAETERAAPHRFARVLGAVGTALASVLFVAGFTLAGSAVAVAVAALAALAAVTGLCLGCRLYRQVQLFQRLGIV
jgi:hypothetical protein